MVYQLELRTSRRASTYARLLGLSLLLTGFAGCDRSDDSARLNACKGFCDKLETCDDRTDLLDCQKHCESDDVRSDAYFNARSQCASSSACNQWVAEVDSQGDDVCSGEDCVLNSCIDRKLMEVKVGELEQQACTALSNALNNCDRALDRDDIQAECKRVTPVLTPVYREDSQKCAQLRCSEIQRCFDDLAKQYATDLRLFSGTVSAAP